MQPLADRADLSLASLGGGIGVILGIALALVVVVAVIFLVLRLRSGGRTNPRRSPKSPRGRTGV